jgi:hypothetical protein
LSFCKAPFVSGAHQMHGRCQVPRQGRTKDLRSNVCFAPLLVCAFICAVVVYLYLFLPGVHVLRFTSDRTFLSTPWRRSAVHSQSPTAVYVAAVRTASEPCLRQANQAVAQHCPGITLATSSDIVSIRTILAERGVQTAKNHTVDTIGATAWYHAILKPERVIDIWQKWVFDAPSTIASRERGVGDGVGAVEPCVTVPASDCDTRFWDERDVALATWLSPRSLFVLLGEPGSIMARFGQAARECQTNQTANRLKLMCSNLTEFPPAHFVSCDKAGTLEWKAALRAFFASELS